MTNLHSQQAHTHPRSGLGKRIARRLAFPVFIKLSKILENITRTDAKLNQINAKLDSLIQRQEEVERHAAAVRSLHWDHSAISLRLAQLEDRLLDAAEKLAKDNGASDALAAASFRFPGGDRFEKGKAG